MKQNAGQKIQCHFISNTHWDREWRYSAQRTRYMLGYLMDMLFDIFEKEPEFKHFHLDSQTMPVQDYLEVYPEKAGLIKKYVTAGKLAIGPWFCLPDEFCVSGESLVRNLLLGHSMAKEFGGVSKTGYAPFGWGQISQMPQLYAGFGIDVTSFYRGLNPYIAPKSEFYWESPDGTRILASRLGKRPRYNVWYILQRPVYWNQQDEDNRVMSWKAGGAPFRFIDTDKHEIDYQYAHPAFAYHEEHVPERARQAIEEQDDDWTQPHRLWSAGHDSSCPDIREARMIADSDRALGEEADVFHSTMKAFQDGIKACADPDWPVLRGEMHNPSTKGSVSTLYGWITSARTYIKQMNFQNEAELTTYAEPMAVFAGLLGAPYPRQFVDLAYNYLLQNHGHDSIGTCGRDIVYEDMIFRYRQSREICSCLMERAMMDIAGSIDLSSWSAEEMALVVYNPAPFKRTEVMSAILEIPLEWECNRFALVDEDDRQVPVQVSETITPFHQIVQSPNDVANTFPSSRYHIRVEFPDVPGLGYRTFAVKPVVNSRAIQPKTLRTGPQTMENDYLTVSINANGTLDVTEKATGKAYSGIGYFTDSGEIGNPWEHVSPENDTVMTTLNARADVSLIRDGELEASYRISIDWALPEGRSQDERRRSDVLKSYPIVNTVTLRKGQPWVEIVTELDNTVEDHYLQVAFPSNIAADHVMAQGQFDVIQRPIAKPDYTLYDEQPMTEQPVNSFVDISDGQVGVALLNEGLKAYSADDDAARTMSVSLLRCFPLRICVTAEMQDYSRIDKGSQCLGKQRFRYAIMPHSGDWEQGGVWQASEQFNYRLQSAQIGPSQHGTQPLSRSFLELKNNGLHISAIKQSESGEGWIVRLFNPSDSTINSAIRLNGGYSGPTHTQSPVERVQAEFALPKDKGMQWNRVRVVSLEELPERDLVMDDEGWVNFEITKKKILTLEFLP